MDLRSGVKQAEQVGGGGGWGRGRVALVRRLVLGSVFQLHHPRRPRSSQLGTGRNGAKKVWSCHFAGPRLTAPGSPRMYALSQFDWKQFRCCCYQIVMLLLLLLLLSSLFSCYTNKKQTPES